jgi:flagellar motor protein MotB
MLSSELNRGNHRLAADDGNPYWISFSDIMAGILVIFILAVVFLILQLSQQRDQIEGEIQRLKTTNQLRAVMLEEIREELEARGIRVLISEDKTILRIPEDLLAFETLEYEIPRDRREVVADIGEVILAVITKNERFRHVDTIFIEGHTDSRRADRFMSGLGNWGLSTARAISVWKYWSEELAYGEAMLALRNQRGEPMFSVSGYGDTRRIEIDDSTPETQRANRRIDVRFSMRAPLVEDLEAIQQNAQ